MRLLERDHPLAVLRDRAGGTAEGRGSILLVAGEKVAIEMIRSLVLVAL